MNRKVLFIHDGPLYFDESNGKYYGVHYNDALVNRYSFFGNEVTFLMRLYKIEKLEISKYSLITDDAFKFIEIPDFKKISHYIRNRKKAKRIIKESILQHDIIIIRFPSAAGTIAFKYALKFKKPVLVEFVACVFDALWNYNWQGKLLACFKFIYYRTLIKKAPHIIYVTDKFLQKRYPSLGKSIGCSDVELIPNEEFVLNKRINNIKKNNNGILSIATIAALDVPYKGQKDVIKALALLKKKGKYFKYYLVGQGDSAFIKKAITKYKVEEFVKILGPLKHNGVFDFLDTVDLYIQPSKQEGMPRALIEAMSMACPALGTRVGGIPELLPEECIYKAGDIKELSKKLLSIDKEWLIDKAKENFIMAKKFNNAVLEEKRKDFYKVFIKDNNL